MKRYFKNVALVILMLSIIIIAMLVIGSIIIGIKTLVENEGILGVVISTVGIILIIAGIVTFLTRGIK